MHLRFIYYIYLAIFEILTLTRPSLILGLSGPRIPGGTELAERIFFARRYA